MAFILFLKLGSCEYAKLETFYPMRKLLSDTKWQSKINSYLHKLGGSSQSSADNIVIISQYQTSAKTAFKNLLWGQTYFVSILHLI